MNNSVWIENLTVYHGTSGDGVKAIKDQGLQIFLSPIPIDNMGKFSRVEGIFVTPHRDIAHLYESHNRPNSRKRGTPRIIRFQLVKAKIFDLTNRDNQNLYIKWEEENDKKLTEFLKVHGYDGVRQIHKNDYGRNRLQYAILYPRLLQDMYIPRRGTRFGELISEANAPDWKPEE